MLVALKKLFWYHKDEKDEEYENNKKIANTVFEASMATALKAADKKKHIEESLEEMSGSGNILEDVFNDIGKFN